MSVPLLRVRASALVLVAVAVAAFALAAGGPVHASHTDATVTEWLVTGHTTLASNYRATAQRGGQEVPSEPVQGAPAGARPNECTVWFNGLVVFDGTSIPGGGPGPDNVLDPCGTIIDGPLGSSIPTDFAALAGTVLGGGLVIAVEAGDCDPRNAVAAAFVRDLSFTDPNHQDHLVAEVRYTCFHESLLSSVTGVGGESPRSSDGDPLLGNGQDPTIANLLWNETFAEYAWVTATHALIVDPTLDDALCLTEVHGEDPGLLGPDPTSGAVPEASEADLWDDEVSAGYDDFCVYNYALIVDTCNDAPKSGHNVRTSRDRCTDGGGEEFADRDPRRGARFDDSSRRSVEHGACPETRDAIRDGNANRELGDPTACADGHREDRTADWSLGAGFATETDYDGQEDHLAARVDVYVSVEDCANGATTRIGMAFCAAPLVTQVVNHPGCVFEHDAVFGDVCWNPMGGPNDARGAGGRDVVEGSVPWI